MTRIFAAIAISSIVSTGCLVLPEYWPQVSLNTAEQNPQGKPIHRILLTGSGEIPTQLFLENLSDEMIASLKRNGVLADFLFTDTLADPVKARPAGITANQFDAILVFKPNKDLHLNMTKHKYSVAAPGVSGKGYGNQYRQSFVLTLYEEQANHEVIWQGDLSVDFDIVTETKYKKLAKMILSELAKKNIVLK